MKHIISYFLITLTALAALSACGILPQEAQNLSRQASAPPIEKTQAPAPAPVQENRRLQQSVRQLLSQQDYVGALSLIETGARHGTLLNSVYHIEATNGCLDEARGLYKAGAYDKAAEILLLVQQNYPNEPDLQQDITESPGQVQEKINGCADKLMEKGLVAYRSGELATAIDIWEQVLAINPGHPAAQNSIQTTQLQISKLKSMNNNN